MAAPAAPSADVTHSPPAEHRPFWWRVAAAGLLALVFWLDTLTPDGVAVPMLYVVPTLLFMWSGRAWEPLVVAAVATALTTAGIYLTPPGGDAGLAFINRPIEIATVWMAASVVTVYRIVVGRWTMQVARDRAALEHSLRGLEDLRWALDQAAIVATTDHRGLITSVNDKFSEISKYSREELLGQDHRIVNSGYHPKAFIQDLWRTIAHGRVWRGEIRNRAKDGTFYWVDTTIVPFLDDQGHPRQYLAIRSDITQRKIAEARLRDEAALTQLGQLAAVVAHEVRNPLAGLRGSLQVLASRLPREMREREIIGTMISRIDSLNAKVTDMLVYARPAQPRLQPVEVGPLMADAVASARAAIGAGCPPVEISGDTVLVSADPEMLRPVLLNLLLNACQAGGDRPIEVVTAAQNGACHVSILDRGPGIPPETLERIFEPFFTTKPGGTGLGLPVVKRLMDLQAGTVSLRLRDGGGTAAEITMPLATT